ncbi:hypothetical protein FRC07_011749, partial [Ceratobasidium sp. 392]
MFSVASSSRALQRAVTPIIFPSDWETHEGPTFDWYQRLSCKRIRRLQIRKDSSGAVPHRFIVAHLADNSIQRFDRRPQSKNAGEIVAASLFGTSTIAADDEIEMVEAGAWPSLEQQTKCEVDLDLGGDMDILTILSACYGISRDASARDYALLRYNCFFFSWTILAIVARHKVPSSIPNVDQVFNRLEPKLTPLTVTLAGQLSQVIMQAVLDTVTAFRQEVGYTTILRGISWSVNKVIWSMPMPVLRFGMQNLMK